MNNIDPIVSFPSSAGALLVAGPTCSGKDTLVEELKALRPELAQPVTSTTRPARPHEIDGVHYHFLSDEAFALAVREDAFVEHANVHTFRYGLTKSALNHVRGNHHIPVVILDVQGVRSVMAQIPTIRVFIRSPLDQIRGRLLARRPKDEVESRLQSVQRELKETALYHLVIDNPDGGLDEAFRTLLAFYDETAGPLLRAYVQSPRQRARTR